MNSAAVIGKSIIIKGELSGQEDLTIDGTVSGKVTLEGNNLVIGPDGNVKASLFARTVTITGKVKGDVVATERVEISETGSLTGNIKAPRVVIRDGAFFEGTVEMNAKATAKTDIASKTEPADKPGIKMKSGKTPAGVG